MLAIVAFGAFALYKSQEPPPNSELIVSPFQPWDGVWEGQMVSKNEAGDTIATENVRFDFRHINARKNFRQEGHVIRTNAETGERSEEDFVHTAYFRGSDKLARRVLTKDRRKAVDFEGYADEQGVITWKREIFELNETRREWIEGDVWHVEGTLSERLPEERTVTYRAEYRRIEDEEAEEKS